MLGSVCFKVEGLNLERQLNALAKEGVSVSNVRRPSRQILLFDAPPACRKKIVDFFRERCYTVTVVKAKGIARIGYFFKKRLALLICLVVACSALLFLNNFVWRVEFDVDERTDKSLLESTLKECRTWTGARIGGIDYKETQNAIFNALPAVKYVGVSVKGCTLFVAVRSEEVPEPVFDFKTPRNLKASADGIIKRIVVVSGTALVKKGDTVVKGQVLIEGKRFFPDESFEEVCAIGEVWAESVHTGQEQFYHQVSVFEKTGKKKEFFSFGLFKFNSKGNSEKVFANQVVEESSQVLFPLPIKLVTRTVFETKEVLKKQDFEMLKSVYEQKALQKALASLGSAKGMRTEFSYEENEAGILVKASIYTEEKISGYD